MISVTGGSPYASVIGNCAERGDGVGPYGDRAEHTCDLEVVLPDGEVLYTGFSRYAEASGIAPLSRWVPGPGLNELFLQSSLGIITRMTVWLMPKPAYLHVAWATFRDGAHLAQATDVFRRLMLQGVLPRNAMTMWNLYKILARKQQFPWQTQSIEEPFLLSSVPAEPWYACAALYYPSREHARVDRRYLLEQLETHVHDLMFLDQEEHPEIANDSLFLGVPTEENIASTYWRKKQAPPVQMDPDRDRCGVLWTCHVVPLQSAAVGRFIEIAERVVLAHGLEPNLGLSCMSVRAMRVFVALMYDRDVEGHDQKAMQCHDAVFSALCAEGFLPYRLGLPSMSLMPDTTDHSSPLLQKIKTLLDPDHVLAPGRYTKG
jgi:4-cresol dehydrogenase (hydroxylating)